MACMTRVHAASAMPTDPRLLGNRHWRVTARLRVVAGLGHSGQGLGGEAGQEGSAKAPLDVIHSKRRRSTCFGVLGVQALEP